MAYPFANNQYAQSASHSHSYDNDYNRSYAHPATHPDQYASTSAPYEQEREYAERPHDRDPYYDPGETITPIAPYGREQEQDLYPSPTPMEKELVPTATPYEKSTDMLTASPYRSNSIWTIDHKRVMAKRSVPVRILR